MVLFLCTCSDHEFIEEQQRHLYATCIRTMALPVGRGMVTLSTYHPVATETLPIPKLCLTGRAPPRSVVGLQLQRETLVCPVIYSC